MHQILFELPKEGDGEEKEMNTWLKRPNICVSQVWPNRNMQKRFLGEENDSQTREGKTWECQGPYFLIKIRTFALHSSILSRIAVQTLQE